MNFHFLNLSLICFCNTYYHRSIILQYLLYSNFLISVFCSRVSYIKYTKSTKLRKRNSTFILCYFNLWGINPGRVVAQNLSRKYVRIATLVNWLFLSILSQMLYFSVTQKYFSTLHNAIIKKLEWNGMEWNTLVGKDLH